MSTSTSLTKLVKTGTWAWIVFTSFTSSIWCIRFDCSLTGIECLIHMISVIRMFACLMTLTTRLSFGLTTLNGRLCLWSCRIFWACSSALSRVISAYSTWIWALWLCSFVVISNSLGWLCWSLFTLSFACIHLFQKCFKILSNRLITLTNLLLIKCLLQIASY